MHRETMIAKAISRQVHYRAPAQSLTLRPRVSLPDLTFRMILLVDRDRGRGRGTMLQGRLLLVLCFPEISYRGLWTKRSGCSNIRITDCVVGVTSKSMAETVGLHSLTATLSLRFSSPCLHDHHVCSRRRGMPYHKTPPYSADVNRYVPRHQSPGIDT
jgi:hypothetical protein